MRSRNWRAVLPTLVLLGSVFIVPFAHMLVLSFQDYTLTAPSAKAGSWAGFANYARVVSPSSPFWHALYITFTYAIVAVCLEVAIGLALAFIISHRAIVARRIMPLIVVPSLLSPTVVALMAVFLFHPRYGVPPLVVQFFGSFPDGALLSDPTTALPTLIAVDIWQWTPLVTAVFLAAILGVNSEAVESARIDGAGYWRLFRTVVFPCVWPTVGVMAAIRFFDAFKEFDKIFVATGGGPGVATETISFYTWRVAFKYWEAGHAAAMGVVLYLLLYCMTYASFSVLLPKRAA